MQRPDLSDVSAEVRAYIEHLEYQLMQTHTSKPEPAVQPEPSEGETTVNVITMSAAGEVKRTPRHFYTRQGRGGMGVFDLETAEDDQPARVLLADEAEDLIIITNMGRVFRLPVADIPQRDVRAKGSPIRPLLRDLHSKEEIADILSGEGERVAVLTQKAYVVTRNRHYLKNGAILFDVNRHTPPVAVCWSTGTDDLFVVTKGGQGIRFWSQQVPKGGCLAMRVPQGDELFGITAVAETGRVLLVTSEGKGTIRLMDGFRKNKSPGASGKVAIKTDSLVAVAAVDEGDDVFMVSRLGKMIRFAAADIPAKTGVVQGVNCMNLRADEVTAAAVATLNES